MDGQKNNCEWTHNFYQCFYIVISLLNKQKVVAQHESLPCSIQFFVSSYVNGKLHNFRNGLVNQLPDCDSKKELSILNFVRVFIFRDIG